MYKEEGITDNWQTEGRVAWCAWLLFIPHVLGLGTIGFGWRKDEEEDEAEDREEDREEVLRC